MGGLLYVSLGAIDTGVLTGVSRGEQLWGIPTGVGESSNLHVAHVGAPVQELAGSAGGHVLYVASALGSV